MIDKTKRKAQPLGFLDRRKKWDSKNNLSIQDRTISTEHMGLDIQNPNGII